MDGVGLLGVVAAVRVAGAAAAQDESATSTNPLPVRGAAHATVESRADPMAVAGEAGDPNGSMVCTTDPLTGADATGEPVFHLLPMVRSADLVHREHQGDALDRDPATATPEPPCGRLGSSRSTGAGTSASTSPRSSTRRAASPAATRTAQSAIASAP